MKKETVWQGEEFHQLLLLREERPDFTFNVKSEAQSRPEYSSTAECKWLLHAHYHAVATDGNLPLFNLTTINLIIHFKANSSHVMLYLPKVGYSDVHEMTLRDSSSSLHPVRIFSRIFAKMPQNIMRARILKYYI
jgi:hypothetical protein